MRIHWPALTLADQRKLRGEDRRVASGRCHLCLEPFPFRPDLAELFTEGFSENCVSFSLLGPLEGNSRVMERGFAPDIPGPF